LIIWSWPRSNGSSSGVLQTIIHQELAAAIGTGLANVIGTGFICGWKKQGSGSRIQCLIFRVFPCVSVANWFLILSASIGGEEKQR